MTGLDADPDANVRNAESRRQSSTLTVIFRMPLIVEFRLEPYTSGKATAVQALDGIAKNEAIVLAPTQLAEA